MLEVHLQEDERENLQEKEESRRERNDPAFAASQLQEELKMKQMIQEQEFYEG